MTMTHAEGCALAVKWLKRPESQKGPGCIVAVSECKPFDNGEIPDALGFRSVGWEEHSVLVEVKVSRADFLADAKKPHRIDPALGLGAFRYYLAPAGLIAVDELPSGWGLIEVQGRALKVRVGHLLEQRQQHLGFKKDYSAWEHPHNRDRERALLVGLLARIGDADTLHRELKAARNKFTYAANAAERLGEQLRQSEQTSSHLRTLLWEAGIEIPPEATRRRVKAIPRRPVALDAQASCAVVSTPSTLDAEWVCQCD